MCSNSAWFRSAEMKHVMIFTPEECAFDLINTLGNLGVMQFDDLNTHKTAFQRTYANSIKRCEEIERILTYIKGEAESMGVDMKDPPEITDFLNRTDDVQQQNTQANERISQMLQRLTSKEKEIRELQKTYAKLLNESNQKRELRYVLTEAMRLHREQDKVMDKTEITSDMGARIRFSRVTGVINTNDRSAFHRLVFRFSRGSCYLRFFDIFEGPQEEEVVFTDPLTGEFVHKTVFIAVFPGSKLRDKIDKICEAFGARIHDVPDVETVGAFESQIRDVTQWLAESEQYLSANRQRTRNILIGLASNYYRTVMQIRSMKGVFHVLNKCYVRKTGFVAARGWMLADKMDTVQDIVRRLGGVKGGGLTESSPGGHITSSPPTYFKTNKFTSVFQNTVDIYGIPRYQEANPALFTAVTFPFLFGVMFGDIGHGILFMMLGVYMVLNEKALGKVKNMNEMLKMAYVFIFFFFFFLKYTNMLSFSLTPPLTHHPPTPTHTDTTEDTCYS
jgi:V-type H+-transporting ATPase subunit a